jgi:hypothetical protein
MVFSVLFHTVGQQVPLRRWNVGVRCFFFLCLPCRAAFVFQTHPLLGENLWWSCVVFVYFYFYFCGDIDGVALIVLRGGAEASRVCQPR